ncbi:M48 family metallopeptidase [Sphingomonas sp. BN140010]|uniref:M48 family metallopeptidase n=1 Tax=Sphingomonas arvum TaxID=2992113 RepID=A0ABT3JFM9_9SPHN|nr:SprT family zinc-dependent metalloprotease [Sphingomonas sp. BN140010]MCW3797749.1 M48 family metallopeptidase [Sphingomonas sp. BN140010]
MSTAIFEVVGLPLPVAVVRHHAARRLRLRIDHERGQLRLTIPPRGSARAALRWAGEQRAWVEAQLCNAPTGVSFADRAIMPFRGQPVTIRAVGGRRGVKLEGNAILVGGPVDSMRRSVERWLRRTAADQLSTLTAEVARSAGVSVRSVSVGDAASRWGSCSSSGAIRYSWRLILAPPQCLRFVVAHEVAHRLHMDHSARFRAAEEQLFGGPVAPARALLRELGPTLRLVGRR